MSDQLSAQAFPAKAFFVKMLTRDISIEDAIMDLIDNCTDGVLRTKWSAGIPESESHPYKGFYAKITVNENEFIIEDNCGGIPRKIAEDYAFRMGRANKRDESLPTVGVYGIGMKRALFKMGMSSRVLSKSKDEVFEVTINEAWLENDDDWRLPLNIVDEHKQNESGTIINVTDLYDGISAIFAGKTFANSLIKIIQQHYSVIIQKGFSIYVNSSKIEPVVTKLLVDTSFDEGSLAPYIYQSTIDGVKVFLQVGFYRRLPNQEEIDKEQIARSSKEEAGWTVICNDRVVIYKDKSILTGWGESNVPQYHTQFIGITGVVIFNSDDVEKLPITTTKRGIDASSPIYLQVKNRMREGMKLFTDYTNKWKNNVIKEQEVTNTAKAKDINEVQVEIPKEKLTKVTNSKFEEYRFVPKLPKPSETNPNKFIRFSKPESEIKLVAEYLFESPDTSPSEVGEECFNRIFREAKND